MRGCILKWLGQFSLCVCLRERERLREKVIDKGIREVHTEETLEYKSKERERALLEAH